MQVLIISQYLLPSINFVKGLHIEKLSLIIGEVPSLAETDCTAVLILT